MPPVTLLTVENVSKTFGSKPLFEGLNFALAEGDHVGVIGPNGSGKSTLMKILAGAETPDSGNVSIRRGVRVGYVPQDPVFAPGMTVEDAVEAALAEDPTIDPGDRHSRVALALSKARFTEPEARTESLSGGWRKRLAIARELVREPDIMLLDEPTNHLDIESILWLEDLLRSETRAFMVVSHDRYFLESIARRVIELSRIYPAGLLQHDGSYVEFLEKRDELMREQASYRDSLANLVRREVEWLRRGPKARTTKAKARIQNAEGLIEELAESRSRIITSNAGIDFTASERKTKRLWSAKHLSKSLGGKPLVSNLDLLLSPGTRLGILGPNGSGKTTLLRMMTGELAPDSGTIEAADRVRIVYFEQNRESLDPTLTLKRALAPEGDSVLFRDRSLHVASWAKRFLFRPEQLETSVSRLSGGEKARIVLARLMLQPADVLILDEPTNDLDIPTLDVLEESLLDFPGALVLVTHDRYLIDRVSTSILALDGGGQSEIFADYTQWESSRKSRAKKGGAGKDAGEKKPKKLSYKEQREWDGMDSALLEAEQRLASARAGAEDPAVAANAAVLQERFAAVTKAQQELESLFNRWAELDGKING